MAQQNAGNVQQQVNDYVPGPELHFGEVWDNQWGIYVPHNSDKWRHNGVTVDEGYSPANEWDEKSAARLMSKPEALVDRMKLLLSTENGADVHFLVEEGDKKERFAVHKAILSAASDVFEAMFRFDTTNTKVENGLAVVVITDVEVEAFRTMLNCIYADDLMGLNGDNLFAVLYAAKKYNIVRLINACLAFPIRKLPNVFFAFAQARFFEENDFARRCMEFIEQNADTLFQSDGFLLIDDILLGEILGRERLAIEEEIVLWNAALLWADVQCAQNGIDCSAENRRQMLGPALHKIRFSRIEKNVFSNIIVPSGMLTVEELKWVELDVTNNGWPPEEKPTETEGVTSVNWSADEWGRKFFGKKPDQTAATDRRGLL